jgi:hypothetical protein
MAPTLSRAGQRLAERAFMWDAVDHRQGEFVRSLHRFQ